MPTRKIINKYFPQLIMIMDDSSKALECIKPYTNNVLMENLLDKVPDSIIPKLWDIIKSSKYKESPKPILDNMNKEIKQCQR